MKKIIILMVSLVFLATWVYSQEYGNIYGAVVDEQDNPLPGVTVTLSSAYYPAKSVMTSSKGVFRFPRLPVAKDYILKFELQNFKTVIREKIEVPFNTSVRQDIVMEPVILEEEVTVVAEVPLVDKKRAPVGVHVDSEKLMSLPTGRTPWALMDLAPGMLVDRVDVGGNQAGQQSTFVANGSHPSDTKYSLDGADHTDNMRGSITGYLKISNYEETNITYGVNDITSYAGGVSVNVVSKRGGNNLSGIFHLNFTRGEPWERKNLLPEWEGVYKGAGLNQTAEYGFGLGGPIVRDKAWFYGCYGYQDINKRALTGSANRLILEVGYFKLNFELSRNIRWDLYYEYDNKTNRDAGNPLTQHPDTFTDQDTPTNIFRTGLDVTSGNLLWSTFLYYFPGGFHAYGDTTGTGKYAWYQYYPTYYQSGSRSDLDVWVIKYHIQSIATYFADDLLGADHEIKFGADYIYNTNSTAITYEGNVVIRDYGSRYPSVLAEVRRDYLRHFALRRYGIFVQDSVSYGRWSFNLGLRYDRETSWIFDQGVSAAPFMSNFLPTLTIDKIDPGVVWSTLSPRFTVSYDLFGNGKDIVKLSLSRYGSASLNSFANFVNPTGTSYIRLLWKDANGDGLVTENELWGWDSATNALMDRNDPKYWIRYTGFNPSDPTAFSNPNRFDPDYTSVLKDEVMLSYEKQLTTDLAAELDLFYNRRHNLEWTRGYFADGHVVTKDDYYVAGHISRPPENLDKDYYGLPEKPVGQYRGNSKQSEKYRAIQLILTKRFSNRWMMDASFTYLKWTFNYNGDYDNPTNKDYWNGGAVTPDNQNLNSRWMFKLSGLYQFPLGFNLSGSFIAREGYVLHTFVQVYAPNIGTVDVYAGQSGDNRLPNLYLLNLRLGRVFHITERAKIDVALEIYNVTNVNMAFSKEAGIDRSNFMGTYSTVNPTILRLAARFSF